MKKKLSFFTQTATELDEVRRVVKRLLGLDHHSRRLDRLLGRLLKARGFP